MKSGKPETTLLATFRLVALVGLVVLILVFVRKGVTEKYSASTALNESSLAFAAQRAVENNPKSETFGTSAGSSIVTRLEGRFSPDDEARLIEQLRHQGYTYFSSYRLDDDGSAVIKAMSRQASPQPLLTIAVDRQGNAVRIE